MDEKSAMAGAPPPDNQPGAYPHYPPQPANQQPPGSHNTPMSTYPNQPMPPGPYDQQYQHHPPGYPQPPPPYFDQPPLQNQYPQHQPHVVMQQPMMQTVIMAPRVGPDPCSMICTACHKQIVTRMEYETSTKTHVVAAICCLFICWPCAWIPYVMDSCKNANHYCPHCNAFIGTYDGF